MCRKKIISKSKTIVRIHTLLILEWKWWNDFWMFRTASAIELNCTHSNNICLPYHMKRAKEKKNRTSKWPWSSESTFYAGVKAHRLHIHAIAKKNEQENEEEEVEQEKTIPWKLSCSHTSAQIQQYSTLRAIFQSTTDCVDSIASTHTHTHEHGHDEIRIHSRLHSTSQMPQSPCVQYVLNQKGNIASNRQKRRTTTATTTPSIRFFRYRSRIDSV